MRRISVFWMLVAVLALHALMIARSPTAMQPAHAASAPNAIATQEYRTNVGHGNLLGIQAYMTPQDYRSGDVLFRKLDTHLALAKKRGWIGSKTVVVFPEAIGFYLFAAQEGEEVYAARSLQEAAYRIFLAHKLALPADLTQLPTEVRNKLMAAKVMELKAPLMARLYQQVFSRLARHYRVTIVAGSIFLPDPSIQNGRLVTDVAGKIYNVCALFRPNGELYLDLVKKVFPTQEEIQGLGIARGTPEALPVFATPAGKIGVAICADSWYPETYRSLQRKGADILVVPSQNEQIDRAEPKWAGYSLPPGVQAPADVEAQDIGTLTEYQAWIKYALPGRMGQTARQATSIPFGVTIFARGKFWEKTVGGAGPLVVARGKRLTRPGSTPAVVTIWLD